MQQVYTFHIVGFVTEIGNKVLIADDEYLAFNLFVYYIITQSSPTNNVE